MKFKKKPEFVVEKKCEDKELMAKEFLMNADQPATLKVDDADRRSWRGVFVEKEITIFSFRIPKKDMQQLKYLSKETGMSINALCLMSIQANNRKMLKEIEDNQ